MEKRPKRLGNIINSSFGTGFAGNVWSRRNVLPSLTTSQGGYREPMVVKRWTKSESDRQPKTE